jgi:hypothetical protein
VPLIKVRATDDPLQALRSLAEATDLDTAIDLLVTIRGQQEDLLEAALARDLRADARAIGRAIENNPLFGSERRGAIVRDRALDVIAGIRLIRPDGLSRPAARLRRLAI